MFSRNDKLIGFLVINLIFLLLLSSCKSEQKDTPVTDTKDVVALLIYDSTDAYLQSVTKAILQNFGDRATVKIAYAANDQLLQNEQIDLFIAEKVDGLIVNIVDTNEAANLSEKTLKANLPIIFFNREPDLNVVNDYANTFFVGTIIEHAGILQGDIIAKLWQENPEYDRNKDGKIQYIMIQANPSNAEAIARTEFSVKQAIKSGLSLQQVGKTFMCEWDDNLAENAISLAWPLIGEQVELIISNNDTMALGAINAIQKYGYNLENKSGPYIPVIGVDALEGALDAINKGIMADTVKQDANYMGKAIVDLVLSIINEEAIIKDPMLQWSEKGRVVRVPYISLSSDSL